MENLNKEELTIEQFDELCSKEELTVKEAKQIVEYATSKSYITIIYLDGLTSIDKDVAEALLEYEGKLSLNGLTSIDKDVAEILSHILSHNGRLSLNGTSIGKDAADALSKHIGQILF